MCVVQARRMTLRTGVRAVLLGGLLAATTLAFAPATRADNIDMKLLHEEGDKIMEYLQKHNYKTVGVLPFRVEKSKQPPSYNVGPMNTNIATRLENMIIAKNDSKKPIDVLHDIVHGAGSRSISMKTAAGRRSLLDNKYDLAWGNSKQKPDVLLTGDVKLSPDNRKVTVIIKAFNKPEAEPAIVHQFATNSDRAILTDCAQSFSLSRSLLKKREVEPEVLDQAAADSATAGDNNQTQPDGGSTPGSGGGATGSDVKFSVMYDGSPATIERDPASPGERKVTLRRSARSGGVGSVTPSPIEGQKVSLVLENTSSTETYAVVLTVNGKNTLFEQEDDPAKCTKWVLGPSTKYELKGFYYGETGENMKPFRVLSDVETKAAEDQAQGDERLGLFSITVFKQGTTGSMQISRKVSLRTPASRSVQAKPKTAAEAKSRIITATKQGVTGKNRNLLGTEEKQQGGGTLEKVSFDNPIQIDSYSVRYHTPGLAGSSGTNP